MDREKINVFLANKSDMFPSESLPMLKERLEQASPEQDMVILATSLTSPTVTLIVSIFVGELGIDRFIIGDVGIGIGKLLLTLCCGIGFIWWLIDLFLIMGATRKKNLKKILLAIG